MKYITFWGRYDPELDTSEATWANRAVHLTELNKLALLSHKRLENEVILYTYQWIADSVPDNVEIRDAEELYDALEAYEDLVKGQRMCHISDIVRLRHVAMQTGVIIDLDTVVLRKFPEEGFIGSMPAKLTGGFAPKWGKAHPPLNIIDNSWDGKALIDFPVSVDTPMRKPMHVIARKIYDLLKGEVIKGFKGWNTICKELEKIPVKILPPFYTCPVPPWAGKGKCLSLESPTRFDGETHLFGHRLPSVEEILEGSLAVQHFFESSFKGEYRSGEGFWGEVKEDSLLAHEAEYVLGKDWRNILNESDSILE